MYLNPSQYCHELDPVRHRPGGIITIHKGAPSSRGKLLSLTGRANAAAQLVTSHWLSCHPLDSELLDWGPSGLYNLDAREQLATPVDFQHKRLHHTRSERPGGGAGDQQQQQLVEISWAWHCSSPTNCLFPYFRNRPDQHNHLGLQEKQFDNSKRSKMGKVVVPVEAQEVKL